MRRIISGILGSFIVVYCATSFAKKIEIKDEPVPVETKEVEGDKRPALKYFQNRKPSSESAPREHFLGLHIGGFIDSESYKWGAMDKSEDNGKMTIGVTYRMGEWTSTMDLLLRVDFNAYELVDGKPIKMTVMPLLVFPEANSKFPLYFGIGLGAGVYFKQISQESALALDYQLIGGVRLFDVFESTGFSFEMGLKNHLHLLSDGQFNGVFAAAGVIFTF
ncbi:MAG: hypothetical protein ABL958_19580 [Bdellovibrionia bacterium]